MSHAEMLQRFENDPGFIAALDQSGGSTPRALAGYGVDASQYSTEAEMFDIIHTARTRVITSEVFTKEHILGAILFEGTMDREISGRGTAEYLWAVKGIVPFLKIDKGLADEIDEVQLMKDMPELDALLAHAKEKGVFGTKERSVIHAANAEGIKRVVDQQFEVAEKVIAAGLMPIVEPEVDIKTPDKAQAEAILKAELLAHLDALGDKKVALKLTLPEQDDFYADLVAHKNVSRVVALSGGYPRELANQKLARNHGVIASFSRALLDGLTAQQSQEEFDQTLAATIKATYEASIA
ncbi:fructose bisphosphate aldolase [Schaalia sp. 19OD2882]|uniref:fructose bisphosphate aldolase n=1 Tax=Schaalia sp. 19OD2882 TaxID=2794089 RepID=UPI001C1F1B09|nr:fructose bisphosphate aldolase [Schaalia sp. 19OD2882]QWW19585.1 fructose bisphosphate aldolase [Schaalia sp. 19OD2882]